MPATANGTFTYDFSAQADAFGENLIQVGTDWRIYQGDVNQIGGINLIDLLLVNGAALGFVVGNVVTDLNGNGLVNLTDVLDCYANGINFVDYKKP